MISKKLLFNECIFLMGPRAAQGEFKTLGAVMLMDAKPPFWLSPPCNCWETNDGRPFKSTTTTTPLGEYEAKFFFLSTK